MPSDPSGSPTSGPSDLPTVGPSAAPAGSPADAAAGGTSATPADTSDGEPGDNSAASDGDGKGDVDSNTAYIIGAVGAALAMLFLGLFLWKRTTNKQQRTKGPNHAPIVPSNDAGATPMYASIDEATDATGAGTSHPAVFNRMFANGTAEAPSYEPPSLAQPVTYNAWKAAAEGITSAKFMDAGAGVSSAGRMSVESMSYEVSDADAGYLPKGAEYRAAGAALGAEYEVSASDATLGAEYEVSEPDATLGAAYEVSESDATLHTDLDPAPSLAAPGSVWSAKLLNGDVAKAAGEPEYAIPGPAYQVPVPITGTDYAESQAIGAGGGTYSAIGMVQAKATTGAGPRQGVAGPGDLESGRSVYTTC